VLAEVSPLARPNAQEYLLRISELTGAPGSQSTVHSHPGVESYFIINGEMQVRSTDGVTTVRDGQGMTGVPGGTPVQVANAGSQELLALVLFAVDAGQPLSSPAAFPRTAPPVSEHMVLAAAALAIIGIWTWYFVGRPRAGARG
jgi:quercetin dioxygenase-like cupin family protein